VKTKVVNSQLHFGTCPINETHYYLTEWCLILPALMCSEVEWACSIILKQTCKVLNCILTGRTKQITLDFKNGDQSSKEKKEYDYSKQVISLFFNREILPTSKIRTLKCYNEVVFDIFNSQNTPKKESAKFLYMVHACSKNIE